MFSGLCVYFCLYCCPFISMSGMPGMQIFRFHRDSFRIPSSAFSCFITEKWIYRYMLHNEWQLCWSNCVQSPVMPYCPLYILKMLYIFQRNRRFWRNVTTAQRLHKTQCHEGELSEETSHHLHSRNTQLPNRWVYVQHHTIIVNIKMY